MIWIETAPARRREAAGRQTLISFYSFHQGCRRKPGRAEADKGARTAYTGFDPPAPTVSFGGKKVANERAAVSPKPMASGGTGPAHNTARRGGFRPGGRASNLFHN